MINKSLIISIIYFTIASVVYCQSEDWNNSSIVGNNKNQSVEDELSNLSSDKKQDLRKQNNAYFSKDAENNFELQPTAYSLKYRRISMMGVRPAMFLQAVDDAQKQHFNSLEVQLEGGTMVPLKEFAEADKKHELIKNAHRAGLEVYAWIHEFEDIPKAWHKSSYENLYNEKNDQGNTFFRADNEVLWQWLRTKYDSIVRICPEIDGYTLTLTESQYWASGDEEVTYKTVKEIYDVLKKYNKKLVYRTFCYTPKQMEVLSKVASRLPTDIVLEAKEVPQDWHFYLPYGPDIGCFPGHEQIVEMDAAGEYWGRSLLLNAFPDYMLQRLRYCVQEKGIKGVVVRINRWADEVRNTFNDINMFAVAAFVNNPSVRPEAVWKQWVIQKFGEKAADIATACLKPTWEATKQTIYTKGYIISDRNPVKSLVKGFEDKVYSPHYWDKTYESTWQRIQHPTEKFILETIRDKQQALRNLEKASRLFEKNKALFTDSVYQELNFQFKRSIYTLKFYSLVSEAKLRYLLMEQTSDLSEMKLQLKRLLQILDLLKTIQFQLTAKHKVNGAEKCYQIYLTNVKPAVFDEFEEVLLKQKQLITDKK